MDTVLWHPLQTSRAVWAPHALSLSWLYMTGFMLTSGKLYMLRYECGGLWGIKLSFGLLAGWFSCLPDLYTWIHMSEHLLVINYPMLTVLLSHLFFKGEITKFLLWFCPTWPRILVLFTVNLVFLIKPHHVFSENIQKAVTLTMSCARSKVCMYCSYI